MTGGRKFVIGAGFALVGAIVAGVVIASHAPGRQSTSLLGAVVEAASDPRRQMPLGEAEVTVSSDAARAVTRSDVSGLFHVTLSPAVKPDQPVTLTVRHSGYQPFEITGPVKDQLYIARLVPVHSERAADVDGAAMVVRDFISKDLRVRYSVKTSATMNVGSFARTFEIAGSGGVPCNGQSRCSPDGKWKAGLGSVSYDAGEGNEFREARVSCIAGPCSFTAIQRGNFLNPGRTMKVSALDWSDTTTFLVQAEVTRTQVSDVVRYVIPVVFGNGMNFTLPGTAEGPSIEADLNGSDIVFPLGPKLFLSWAACTLQTDADGAKLYRCELKAGYGFR